MCLRRGPVNEGCLKGCTKNRCFRGMIAPLPIQITEGRQEVRVVLLGQIGDPETEQRLAERWGNKNGVPEPPRTKCAVA